ncbi:MAG: type 11 methyltransferase [Gammaproteobacteria bacterium]|nr:MAG: type 11 methyltransferase [Gammaproteobacteria bacterium]TND01472.1 MAG: type 11 methyltransferase [Gammaproteobacteria bacterium]
MYNVAVFEDHAEDYDRWFDDNAPVYQAELDALRCFLPLAGRGLDVGTGTGRFAAPLGVDVGVDPALAMLRVAKQRGLSVVQAFGEHLPFRNGRFDYVLMVTVVCFVARVPVLFAEARRVLKADGQLIVGFIDRSSALGSLYKTRKSERKFYRSARFYSVNQIADDIRRAGFNELRFCQTIIGIPVEGTVGYRVEQGFGDGSFVVVSARRT